MAKVSYNKDDIIQGKVWRFTARPPDHAGSHLFRAEIRRGVLHIGEYNVESVFPYRFDSFSEGFRPHKTESEVIILKTLLVIKSFIDVGEVMALKELLIELDI